jgi:hypothetical protein
MATETRQWKGLRWGYDAIIVSPFDTSSCEYCLTIPEVEAILAITEFMGWATRWESLSGLEIDKAEIVKFQEALRRKLMSNCCDDGTSIILHRIDPETGLMQVSVDGGTTWTSDPQDPRVSGVVQPPSVTAGINPDKCNAAQAINSGYQGMILHTIAQKTNSASQAELIAGMAAVIVGIFGGAIPAAITAIFGGAISFLIESDASTMSAAFTETTFGQIKCALFCTIGDNGAFTDTQFSALLAKIGTDVTDSYAKTATLGFFRDLQAVGLNNWASTRISTGADCSDCDCAMPCDTDNWVTLFGTDVSRTSSHIVTAAVFSSGDFGGYGVIIEANANDKCCQMTATAIVGSITTVLFIACGNNDYNHGGSFVGGSGAGTTARSWLYASASPFTVDIELAT